MTELQMLKEILDSASETGLTAYYWWLAYKFFFNVTALGILVLFGRGLTRLIRDGDF